MENLKKYIICFGLGALATLYIQKPREVMKEQSKATEQERVVIVEKKADGSVRTETKYITKTETKLKEVSKPAKKLDYGIGIGVAASGYSALIARRIIGDLSVYGQVGTNGHNSIGLIYNF